jgi:hypothetical protein
MAKAMQRLTQLEKRIYESTPELLQMNRKKSKGLETSNSRPGSNSVKRRKDFIGGQAATTLNMQNTVLELQAQLEKEQLDNRRMKQDMEKRLERYVRREQEFRRTISDYETQLRMQSSNSALTLSEQANKNLVKIQELQDKVIENIGYIQHKTSKILQSQEEDIVKQFNSKLSVKERELEEEKRRKFEGVDNFAEKETLMVRELELMRASIEFIESRNKKLTSENQELKAEYRSQENDREMLMRTIIQLRREGAALKEELAKYKEGRVSVQADDLVIEHSSSKSSVRTDSSNEVGMNRYETIISRLKRMVEIERKNLRAARTAQSKELESRTELEQLLRKCVDDVKLEIHRRRSDQRTRSKEPELTSADREKIIEVLLSQERVLTLLYDKTFPPRVVTRERGYSETEPPYTSSLANIDHNIQSIHDMYIAQQSQPSEASSP